MKNNSYFDKPAKNYAVLLRAAILLSVLACCAEAWIKFALVPFCCLVVSVIVVINAEVPEGHNFLEEGSERCYLTPELVYLALAKALLVCLLYFAVAMGIALIQPWLLRQILLAR